MSWPLCEARGCLTLAPAGPLVHGGVLLSSVERSGDLAAFYRNTVIVTITPGGLLPDEVEKFLQTLPPLAIEPRPRQRGLFDDDEPNQPI